MNKIAEQHIERSQELIKEFREGVLSKSYTDAIRLAESIIYQSFALDAVLDMEKELRSSDLFEISNFFKREMEKAISEI